LKELKEGLSTVTLRQLRRKEFTSKFGLLGCTSIVEIKKDGINFVRIDVDDIPTGIEISGLIFGCHETSIKIGGHTTRAPQLLQTPAAPAQEIAAMRRLPEPSLDLRPLRPVNSRRQVPVGFKVGHH
jgi:hypothetical protein